MFSAKVTTEKKHTSKGMFVTVSSVWCILLLLYATALLRRRGLYSAYLLFITNVRCIQLFHGFTLGEGVQYSQFVHCTLMMCHQNNL